MRVYVDGENARRSIAGVLCDENVIGAVHEMHQFPIRKLLEAILDNRNLQIDYYAAKIKLPKGYEPSLEIQNRANKIKAFARQWVPQLNTQNIEYIKAGYLKVKSGQVCPKCKHVHEVLQEKGVDVRIAVDILDHAFKTPRQTIVIFSSDTDLVPALDRVKKAGTHIVYVAYSGAINRAVSAVAHETITFTAAKIVQLCKETNGKT